MGFGEDVAPNPPQGCREPRAVQEAAGAPLLGLGSSDCSRASPSWGRISCKPGKRHLNPIHTSPHCRGMKTVGGSGRAPRAPAASLLPIRNSAWPLLGAASSILCSPGLEQGDSCLLSGSSSYKYLRTSQAGNTFSFSSTTPFLRFVRVLSSMGAKEAAADPSAQPRTHPGSTHPIQFPLQTSLSG